MKITYKPVGDFIHEVDIRNTEGNITNLMGVNLDKILIPSVANIIDTDLTKYKIVNKNQFVCKLMSIGRDGRLPIALYNKSEKIIISSAYFAFEVNDEREILTDYLWLCFIRPIFDKELWFKSGGDVRGGVTWDEFCKTKIPYIDIEDQKLMVKKYKTIVKRIDVLSKMNYNLEYQAYLFYENSVKNIDTFCQVQDLGRFLRGKNITSDEMVNGKYEVISAGITNAGYHNEYNVKGPSICISASGVNAGYVSIHSNNVWASDCSFCNDSNYLFYLYCSLQKNKNKIDILKDGHSAQPHVYAKDINILQIPLLDRKQLKRLDDILSTFFKMIFSNKEEIIKLNKLLASIVSII